VNEIDELIDDALGAPDVEPRARLRAEVMAAVRREAAPPLPFPWRRVLAGLGLASAAASLCALLPDAPVAVGPAGLALVSLLVLGVPTLLACADAA
jgi:hypothetical protein